MNKKKLKKRIKELKGENVSFGVKTMLAYVKIEELKEQLLIQRVSQQRELFFSLMDFMKSQSRVSMMSHGMYEELWNEFKERN